MATAEKFHVDSAPNLEWTEAQNEYAYKLFSKFDFNHPAFRDRDYGHGSQRTIVGDNLRGYRTGLNRMMDVIEGKELSIGRASQGEVFDCLAQMYVARKLKRSAAPENALREIREQLAFVDFAVWRRLEQELADHADDYPDTFLDGLEPPREIPRVQTFEGSSFP
jgi:hypothetical protein